jgi:YggT family protein
MTGTGILANFISIFALVLTWAIIIRALLSWFSISGSQPLFRLLMEITEPVLAPIRRILPGGMMLDFSPLIAILLIQIVSGFVIAQLPG